MIWVLWVFSAISIETHKVINEQSKGDRKAWRRSLRGKLICLFSLYWMFMVPKISLGNWQTKMTQAWPLIIRRSHCEEKYRHSSKKSKPIVITAEIGEYKSNKRKSKSFWEFVRALYLSVIITNGHELSKSKKREREREKGKGEYIQRNRGMILFINFHQ